MTLSAREFTDTIQEVSKEFCEIYSQAMAAEQYSLDQVCGVGYRKALEFLIKDYAISVEVAKQEEIKSSPLAACIERYVDDPRIRSCASMASWLGNDETHYTRRWIDKDLRDLKVLIELTRTWIENVKLTEKYESEMQKERRTP